MAIKSIINGYVPSWSLITIDIDGEQEIGIKSITYKHAVSKASQYGLGKQRYGVAVGKYTAEASFEIYGMAAVALREKLIAKAATVPNQNPTQGLSAPSYADVRFNVRVSYVAPNGQLIVDKILRAEIMDEEAVLAQGEDGEGFKYTLLPEIILMNGKPLTSGLSY